MSFEAIKQYEEFKKKSLALYDKYRAVMGKDARDFSNYANRIKNRDFRVCIVGVVKAGKSTLINAIVGEEILPSRNWIECTSAAINIKAVEGTDKVLKVKFADGSEKEYKENIYETIRQIGTVPDKYRNIPFQIINNHLIRDINYKPNIKKLSSEFNQDLTNSQELIFEYCKEYKNLDKIPLSMIYDYPLKNYKEIRLIDTPGMDTTSSLSDITIKEIRNSDAVIFVQDIREPENRSSFSNLIKNVVTKKTKRHLFLIVTHAKQNSDEVELKKDKYINAYKHYIDENRIIFIDSLCKIVSDELDADFPEIDKLLEHYKVEINSITDQIKNKPVLKDDSIDLRMTLKNKKAILEEALSNSTDKSDKEECFAELRKLSNFDEFEKKLSLFCGKAPFYYVFLLIESIIKDYTININRSNFEKTNLKKDYKDPKDFEYNINKIKTKLKKLETDLNKYVKEFNIEEFVEPLNSKLKKNKSSYETSINAAENYTQLEKESQNILDEIFEDIKKLAEDYYVKLEESIKGYSDLVSLPEFNFDIGKIDVKELERKFQTDIGVLKTVPDGKAGWCEDQKYRKVIDKDKMLNKLKSNITNTISNKITSASVLLQSYLSDLVKEYSKEINQRLKGYKEDLQNTESIYADATEKKSRLEEIEKYISLVNNEMKITESILNSLTQLYG